VLAPFYSVPRRQQDCGTSHQFANESALKQVRQRTYGRHRFVTVCPAAVVFGGMRFTWCKLAEYSFRTCFTQCITPVVLHVRVRLFRAGRICAMGIE
jgi:hypothetical protein